MARTFKLPVCYAHRGYYDKPGIPENSLAAFCRAVEYGLPSEFDVHIIADGSLVVFHDDDLERMTGVKGSIEAYDITNLRKLRLEGTDEMIPTFDEVLEVYEDSGLPLLIELLELCLELFLFLGYGLLIGLENSLVLSQLCQIGLALGIKRSIPRV